MTNALHSLTIDEAKRLIIIRLISRDETTQVFDGLNPRLLALEAPWEYDVIYDLRRYDAIAHIPEMQAHAEMWQAAINGRDAGRATLIVTRDPLIRSRIGLYREHSPRRIVEMFDTFDEALDWFRQMRDQAA